MARGVWKMRNPISADGEAIDRAIQKQLLEIIELLDSRGYDIAAAHAQLALDTLEIDIKRGSGGGV